MKEVRGCYYAPALCSHMKDVAAFWDALPTSLILLTWRDATMWGLFLNPQSSNSSPFTRGGPAGTPMLGFDDPQLFSLHPGWANAAGEVASITIANSAVSRLRIALPPSPRARL